MWPKSACDFLAPLLLSRNRRFAEGGGAEGEGAEGEGSEGAEDEGSEGEGAEGEGARFWNGSTVLGKVEFTPGE